MKVLIRLIPFSFRRRHASKSSVVDDHASTSRSSKSAEANTLPRGDEDGLSSSTKVRMKRNPFGFVGLRKSRMSTGIRRFINSMKNCSSQLFVYRLDMEEEDEEEAMEIGYPTDVKHVTHIGLDGTTTTTTTTSNTTNCALKSWQNLKPPEIISLPSITFKQFELAMAAQVHAQK